MGDEIWDEHQNKNWFRGAKGLEFLQDGLKDFVGDKALDCRDQQLQRLYALGFVSQCNQCTSKNLLPDHATGGKTACKDATCIERSSGNCFGSKPRGRRKCPKGICCKLYDAIVSDHRYNSPLWKGTDPSTWCSDPFGWSVAKCYQTTPGPATSAQDTDAAGLLSFIINSKYMQNWLACNQMGSKTRCLFQKTRDIRNEILHKAKMELDDQTLDGYLDIFIAVLQDPKYLATSTGSQDAVHKITQLKSKQIHISQWDETKIRKMREEALSEIEERTQEALTQIEKAERAGVTVVKKTETDATRKIKITTICRLSYLNKRKAKFLQEIKRAKITALSDMNRKRKRTLQGIKTTASIGESAVKKKTSDALHEIKVATTSGLSDMNKTKADGMNELNATTSSGLSDLNRKTTEAMQEIDKAKTNIMEEVIYKRQQKEVKRKRTLQGIKTTASIGESVMKRAKITALPDMGRKGKRTLQGIKTTASIGESAVKKKKTEALHEIKVATTSGLSDVNKTNADGVNELNATTSSELSDLNRKTTEAMQEIKKAKKNIMEEVIYKRQQNEIFKLDGRQPTTSQNEHSSTVISEPLSVQVKTPILGEDGPYLKMKTVAGDTRYDESDIQKTKRAIDKAWGNFIDYMEPDPILDCVIEIDLFGYRETRDIKEEKNTTEKNRRILEKVRSKGEIGYEKFKDCLHKTDQSILVKLLECIEREEDTSSLLQQIKEKKTQETMKEPLSAQVKTPKQGEDEAYLKMRTELQDDLIESYRQEHSTIVLAPLADEKCTPLLPFYVMPDIQTIKIKRSPGVGEEERTLVKPFRNVFYSGNNVLRQIYLTADAGLGKSAFCKRLALTWCQAKKPIKDEKRYFSQEEIEALAEFDFIFLLMLRDSSEECDIDDMILNQLIPKLANTDNLQRDDLKKITNKESCLVILDGLDEWTHSSTKSCKPQHGQIPHAKARQWTVLTTTRPWKLSLSGLSSCQIDQRLEITGLSRESADKLKRSVIAHLYRGEDENKLEQYVNDFNRAAQGKHVSDLEAVPLLLMYMLFLRHDKIELGESLCELYSNIIELLLSRTVETCEDRPPKSEHTQDKIPQCLRENELCPQFYTILTDLGHLAFQTLFKETRDENTLVFASSVAKQYLNEQCLKFCLKTGMITESKIQGKLLKQESKVSFAHKTIQEFFAALYIRSIPDQTSVQETVLSKCTCVKDILEMSKILIFLSGFNVNVSSSISRELMKIINEDEITREYRSSLQYRSEPLKQFQDMCVSCCKELPHENEVNISLQDVFIDDSCQQEQYREKLKQLTSRNKQNIRSLHIHIGGMSRTPYSSAQKVIEDFALSDLENIEKIYYSGECNDRDILPLLKSSVKSLYLSCSESSWSVLLYEKVTSLQNLEAIDISRFKMSHEQLTLLYDYISQRQCMRDINLRYLDCTDHGRDSCTGCCLNLSKHSKLRKITLDRIPVSELNINMSSLEECGLQHLSNPDLVLRFINCVPADSKVNKFECWGLKSSGAIETIQQTLPLLVHVKDVRLWWINLGNRNLLSTEMVNIKSVHLFHVTMPASVVRGIVTVLQQLTQTVTVDILSCNITPESEFVTVKEEIKQSSKFRVSVDSEDGSRKTLVFETIKDGD